MLVPFHDTKLEKCLRHTANVGCYYEYFTTSTIFVVSHLLSHIHIEDLLCSRPSQSKKIRHIFCCPTTWIFSVPRIGISDYLLSNFNRWHCKDHNRCFPKINQPVKILLQTPWITLWLLYALHILFSFYLPFVPYRLLKFL